MRLGRGPPRLQVQSTADLVLSHSNLSSSELKLAGVSYSHYSNNVILKPHSNDGLEPSTKFLSELTYNHIMSFCFLATFSFSLNTFSCFGIYSISSSSI